MAQDNFYNYNKNNIQGGAGRLIVSNDTSFRPEAISDIMDLDTYKLKDGFRDLGATNEGIQRSRGNESEDVEIDQSTTPIDTTITSWENTITTTLMETDINNRQLANAGGVIEKTAPKTGSALDLAAPLKVNARQVKVSTSENGSVDKSMQFVKVGNETAQVASVKNNIITLKKPLKEKHEESEKVVPILELGTKRIGYGAPSSVAPVALTLIARRDDGTFLLVHYYEVKISDNVETNHGKEKATLPITLTAYAQDDLPDDENVYIEIEQTLGDEEE